jgi:hypothetical protein
MPDPVLFLNGNDPVDLGIILIEGMLEYFTRHMGENAKDNFANFMIGMSEELLSEKGQEILDKAREKREGML